MQRLVKLTLVVDVEAWQSINQETVDALVNRFGGLIAVLASFVPDHSVESLSMPLKRPDVSLRASQVTVESALVALEKADLLRNFTLVDG